MLAGLASQATTRMNQPKEVAMHVKPVKLQINPLLSSVMRVSLANTKMRLRSCLAGIAQPVHCKSRLDKLRVPSASLVSSNQKLHSRCAQTANWENGKVKWERLLAAIVRRVNTRTRLDHVLVSIAL